MKDLTPEEVIQFDKAKDKELSQWLSTKTIRRILCNRTPEGQLVKARWVLTWKPVDSIEAASLGANRKAKARLVILDYMDPNIENLPRDSPTWGKDSRMLTLQSSRPINGPSGLLTSQRPSSEGVVKTLAS